MPIQHHIELLQRLVFSLLLNSFPAFVSTRMLNKCFAALLVFQVSSELAFFSDDSSARARHYMSERAIPLRHVLHANERRRL